MGAAAAAEPRKEEAQFLVIRTEVVGATGGGV